MHEGVRSGRGWDKDEADSHFEMDMLWSVDNQAISIVCIKDESKYGTKPIAM
jgi:hypothetical protein